MLTYSQKITFADMRASGVRNVLIYCRDHRCSHHIEISADRRGPPYALARDGPLSVALCGGLGTSPNSGNRQRPRSIDYWRFWTYRTPTSRAELEDDISSDLEDGNDDELALTGICRPLGGL